MLVPPGYGERLASAPRPARQLSGASLPSAHVEIYIASFAGLLSSLLLVVVYLADRWEREPIELIQSSFLSGLLAQLLLILAFTAAGRSLSWSGSWVLITVVGGALYLPFQLHRQSELDEAFDGIVYTVAFIGGAVCAIHLNNLPRVIAASPHGGALAPGATPDLRDLLIVATSSGFATELGQGAVTLGVAVLIGAALGVLQLRGWSPQRTAAACAGVALAGSGLDLVCGGAWPPRLLLAGTAVAIAAIIKRRSAFRGRPEESEPDLVVRGLKTVLMIFGAALLATVLMQAASDQPHEPVEISADRSQSPTPGPGAGR